VVSYTLTVEAKDEESVEDFYLTCDKGILQREEEGTISFDEVEELDDDDTSPVDVVLTGTACVKS